MSTARIPLSLRETCNGHPVGVLLCAMGIPEVEVLTWLQTPDCRRGDLRMDWGRQMEQRYGLTLDDLQRLLQVGQSRAIAWSARDRGRATRLFCRRWQSGRD